MIAPPSPVLEHQRLGTLHLNTKKHLKPQHIPVGTVMPIIGSPSRSVVLKPLIGEKHDYGC